MIDVYPGSIVGVVATISIFTAIVSLILFIIFIIKAFHGGKNRKLKSVLMFVTMSSACLSLLCALIFGSIYKSDVSEYYANSIKDCYKAEVLDSSKPINPDDKEGIMVKFDDSRTYEVYLITDKRNKVSLYTKSTKGAYMPIAPVSVQAAYGGVDS